MELGSRTVNAVILRFPHGTEYQWTSDVPAVGQVVRRGSTEWIVVRRNGGELPSFVLEPRGPERIELAASAAAG